MALGLGDGGEQNAPLGRAVIGGLLCATVATLLFVPSVFALIHGSEKSERRARRNALRRSMHELRHWNQLTETKRRTHRKSGDGDRG